MTEHLSPLDHLRHAGRIGKVVLLSIIDRADTKAANALNGPDDHYPRLDYAVEAPAATEEELGGAA